MTELRSLPADLRPRPLAELRRGLADLSTFVLSQLRETSGLGYSYPAQFTDHVFEGADGERIAASIAVHDSPRPALIVVHGLFTSRRFDYVRQIAVDAYYEWGFDVAAVDLRSFGLTNYTSAAPSSAGWKEGEDLVALGALSEAARRDQRRRAGDLARRLRRALRLRPRGRRRVPRRRRPRGLASGRAAGRRRAPLAAGPAHPSRLRPQLRLPRDAHLARAGAATGRSTWPRSSIRSRCSRRPTTSSHR